MAKKPVTEPEVAVETAVELPVEFVITTNNASELKIEGAALPDPPTGEGVDSVNQA